MPHARASSMLCFACSRCDYPLCEAADVLVAHADDKHSHNNKHSSDNSSGGSRGASARVFCYHLDDLLDMDCSVPCYSADDDVDTLVGVSTQLLHVPLMPAARLVALHAVVDAHRASATLSRQEQQRRQPSPPPPQQSLLSPHRHDDAVDGDADSTSAPPRRPRAHAPRSASVPATSLRRYCHTTRQRTDLVCVRASVVDHGGVRVCACSSRDGDSSSHEATASVEYAQSLPPRRLHGPGNVTVREEFVTVTTRRAATARDGWFDGVDCAHRVECAECHLGLGYVFVRREATNATTKQPQQTTCTTTAAATASSSTTHGSNTDNDDDNNDSNNDDEAMPRRFVGLELKKLRQRQWTLRDFHARYEAARALSSFRTLVAGAEERDELHVKLAALRRQAELYRDMLTVSKSKSDIHDALTQSQTKRIALYETKLQALEQVVRTLRDHNHILNQCLQQHTQLTQTTRVKVQTQDAQIRMQTTLIEQQGQLIRVQREQMRLLQHALAQRSAATRRRRHCGDDDNDNDDDSDSDGHDSDEQDDDDATGGSNTRARREQQRSPQQQAGLT